MNILIICNNESYSKLLCKRLDTDGHDVVLFNQIDDSYFEAELEKYELIIMDFAIAEFADVYKNMQYIKLKYIHLIVLTPIHFNHSMMSFIKILADYTLIYPFQLNRLSTCINEIRERNKLSENMEKA